MASTIRVLTFCRCTGRSHRRSTRGAAIAHDGAASAEQLLDGGLFLIGVEQHVVADLGADLLGLGVTLERARLWISPVSTVFSPMYASAMPSPDPIEIPSRKSRWGGVGMSQRGNSDAEDLPDPDGPNSPTCMFRDAGEPTPVPAWHRGGSRAATRASTPPNTRSPERLRECRPAGCAGVRGGWRRRARRLVSAPRRGRACPRLHQPARGRRLLRAQSASSWAARAGCAAPGPRGGRPPRVPPNPGTSLRPRRWCRCL